MFGTLKKTLLLATPLLVLSLAACEDESPPPTRVAPPPSASASASTPSVLQLSVAKEGQATFLIDAPLEKIKGQSTRLDGSLQVDPNDVKATRGQIAVDLSALHTATFDDEAKNAKQTEHARNWLELGADVPEKERTENQWVRFTIRSIRDASVERLADAPEKDGKRTFSVTAEGDLWLHGVSSPKVVELDIEVEGAPASPRSIRVVTSKPLSISLKEHDVKPRDVTGKFLDGALELVGKKIDDRAQISVDLRAAP